MLLRAVDYGERDRVATLFTRSHGRLSAFAPGARGSRRRFVAAFEPFALIRVELVRGRGELWRLRDATVSRAFGAVLRDLDRMAAASAALEIVRESVPEGATDPEVLGEVIALFEAIDRGEPPRQTLVGFALRACAHLGHAPRLDACATCGRPRPRKKPAFFDGARGGVVCQSCGGGPIVLGAATLDRMQRTLDGEIVDWPAEPLAEAARVLVDHLQAQVGKELPCVGWLTR